MSYTVRVLLRVVGTFAVLLILTRLTGKKQISQSTFFDFITAIAVGDIAGEKLSDPQYRLLPWLVASVLWFGMAVGMDLLVVSNRKIAKLVEGEPTVVIENGRILERKLKANYLRVDELMAHLRKKSIFSPSEVEYAVFETDGTVSVQPKSQNRPVTPKDLKISTSYEGLSRELIVDGEIIELNLKEVGLTESWLRMELSKQGYSRPEDLFYASLDTNGELYVDGYKDRFTGERVRVPDYGPKAEKGHGQEYGPH